MSDPLTFLEAERHKIDLEQIDQEAAEAKAELVALLEKCDTYEAIGDAFNFLAKKHVEGVIDEALVRSVRDLLTKRRQALDKQMRAPDTSGGEPLLVLTADEVSLIRKHRQALADKARELMLEQPELEDNAG